jgi:hypothetical protein
MPNPAETVRPSSLEQIQSSIEGWFEGVFKGTRLPIRFSHSTAFPNRLCLLSTPTPDFKVEIDQRTILLQLKRHRLLVFVDDFDVRTELRDKKVCFHLEKELPRERITEAVAAPTDYLVFLNAVSASSLASESAADDPLAAAKFRGLERKRQLVEAAGGALTAQSVADLLGITRQAVDKRRTQNQLLALTQGKRGYIYPSFQFEDGKTVGGLEEVLQELKSFDPWMQLAFFVNSNDRLGGKTPATALRAGNHSEVSRAARSYGEHGAA